MADVRAIVSLRLASGIGSGLRRSPDRHDQILELAKGGDDVGVTVPQQIASSRVSRTRS
jgi:hypothetical protein